MKKLLLTLAVIVAATTTANAQLGVTAGYLNQTNTAKAGNSSSEVNFNGGFAGVEFKVPVIGDISIVPGVNASFLFSKPNESSIFGLSSKGQYTDINLNVPIEVRYDLNIAPDTDFFVYAGPNISYGLNAKYKYEGSLTGKTVMDLYGDNYSRINVGANFGFGFVILDNIQGKVGYNLGLVDRSKSNDVKLTTSWLSLGVAYLF